MINDYYNKIRGHKTCVEDIGVLRGQPPKNKPLRLINVGIAVTGCVGRPLFLRTV